jgi:hypothetical protein
MYPDDVADSYVTAIRTQFGDLDEGLMNEIVEKAREIGKNARPLYHLQPS